MIKVNVINRQDLQVIALFISENAHTEVFESKRVDILLVIMILDVFNRVQNSMGTLN